MVGLVEDLEALHRRMEDEGSKLDVQAAPESIPVQEDRIAGDRVREFLDSAAAETAGLQLGRAIGEGLVALFSNLVPSAEERAAARARAAAKISTPPTAATPPVVAPSPVEAPPPAPSTSGIELVGHLPEKPE